MLQEKILRKSEDLDVAPRAKLFRLSETTLQVLLAGVDLLIIFLTVAIAPIAYFSFVLGASYDIFEFLKVAIESSTVAVLFLIVRRNYRVQTLVSNKAQFGLYVQGWFAGFIMVMIEAFMTRTTASYSRGGMLFAFLPGFFIAYGLRAAVFAALRRRILRNEIVLSSIFMIHLGGKRGAEVLSERLLARGIVVAGMHRVPATSLGGPAGQQEAALADAVDAARRLFALHRFDAIYVMVPWAMEDALLQLQDLLRRVPLPVVLLPDPFAFDMLQARPVELVGVPGFEIQRAPLAWNERALKRLFDVSIAGLGLLLFSPVLIGVAIAVLVTSGRPIFFRQRRRGFGGRTFSILKFRTMSVQEDGAVIRQAQRGDKRVTPIGAFLRSHSLDELPQLWNVVRGDMSLVGPRPHAEAHDQHYDPLIDTYAMRHHVKPGITGWAQVNGCRGETRTVADMEARVQHDIWYIDNFSPRLDFYILYRTVLLAFRDEAAY